MNYVYVLGLDVYCILKEFEWFFGYFGVIVVVVDLKDFKFGI